MNQSALDIASVANLPRTELATRWRAFHSAQPPRGISRRLLVGAIAYVEQAKQQGGPSAALTRRMEKLVAGAPLTEVAAPRALKPGARLVREWNGNTHIVNVVEDGFDWNGIRYRSLSAVARAITGARWSGPRFFGIG